MTCLSVQIRGRPGSANNVVDEIGLREKHSKLYSICGNFDLLPNSCVPKGEDIGRFINDKLLDIDGIERTHTTQTYNAI